jgi:hypothetical protein
MSTSVILSQLEALKVSDLRLEMEAIGLPSKGNIDDKIFEQIQVI